MVKGVQFLNYRCGRSPWAPTTPFKATPIYSAVNHPRGGRRSPPYPAIIKCFGTMWGIYKRWSNLFSLSPRSNGKYWLFFNRDKTWTCVLDCCGGFPLGWVWVFFLKCLCRCNRWRSVEDELKWVKACFFFVSLLATVGFVSVLQFSIQNNLLPGFLWSRDICAKVFWKIWCITAKTILYVQPIFIVVVFSKIYWMPGGLSCKSVLTRSFRVAFVRFANQNKTSSSIHKLSNFKKLMPSVLRCI